MNCAKYIEDHSTFFNMKNSCSYWHKGCSFVCFGKIHCFGEAEVIPYSFQEDTHKSTAEKYTSVISNVALQEAAEYIGRKAVMRLINSCRCSCKDNPGPVKKKRKKK